MEKQIKTMPVIALKGMVILPGMLVHLDIKRDISKKAVDEAMAGEGVVFITNQNDENVELPLYKDLRAVGVVAKIRQVMRLEEDVVRALVSTTDRATLLCLNQNEPYLTGDVDVYETAEITDEVEYEAMCREARQLYEKYLIKNPSVGRSAYDKIQQSKSLGQILDLIMMHIPMSFEMRQCFLECFDLRDRFYYVLNFVGRELDILEERQKFCQAVKTTLEKNQKEYYLREQMRAIRQELGDVGESQADGYRNQADELICSDEVREKIEQEIKRFESLPANSSETSVSQDYIENLLALPWDKMDETPLDLAEAEAILEEDHYGLQKVKERILEFLAVRTLTGNGEAPILCLVGPPGTGKTSIAKSVARALHKEYVRICLGGVRDEAEIRGHRRTYIGAMPGKIIAGLKKAKVKNPLMLLDEIDKVSSDYKGDTSSALLEVLDPEQNQNFADHYIELPVDLSEVVFLCTANTLDTIPGPLLDRMEVLEIAGYTENEKFHIGKQYLIPKQIKKNGLKKSQLVINDKALKTIISEYTREAGVRGLERQIGKICRKTAKLVVEEQQEKVRVSGKNIEEFLGKKKFRPDMANAENEIGIVRGLAWTQVGGDTLQIEVNIMPGKGELLLTGQLGDVMKESAQAGISYIRSVADQYKIDPEFFQKHDMHVHIPEGAVPKDGPSAGITMATAMLSAIIEKPVRADLAMTGEITLRGRVLPIGGLKEKLLAAKYAKIKEVLVPEKNRPDIEEMDKEIIQGLNIQFVDNMKEVLGEALA